MLPRLALLVQTLIAAATFLVAKEAVGRFEPLPLVWFRIMLSAAIMGGVFLARSRRLPAFTGRDWGTLLLLGLLGVSINQGLFLYGLDRTTPLHAALLYACTPILVLALAAAWFGETLTWFRGCGAVLAVSGVTLVLTARGLDLSRGPLMGDLFVLVAVAAWSLFTILGKPIIRRHGAVTVITWTFAMGAASMVPLAPFMLRGFSPAAPGIPGWLGLLYLSAMTSGLAFTLWYWALKRLDASQAAVFNNLQPPLTALLVWWVYGTVPGWMLAVGGLLVLLGVSMAQIPPGRSPFRRVPARGAPSRE